jgi:hypothetical protein
MLVATVIDNLGAIIRHPLYPQSSGSFYFSPKNTSTIDKNILLLGLGKDRTTLTCIKTTHLFYRMSISDN